MPEHGDEQREEALQRLALYNYGNYTSMRISNGAVRGLRLHLERLSRDSSVLFGRSIDADEVLQQVRKALEGPPDDVVVRVTVCADDFAMHRPADASQLRVMATSRPAPTVVPGPITLATAHYARELPEVKHVGLFGQLWHRRAAQLAGREDVLFVDAEGRVLEGATWNVGFIWRDGHVVWPDSAALPGVTQALVKARYERQRPGRSSTRVVRLDDLPDYESAFITNAVTGVRPVSLIDEQKYTSDSPILDDLAACYSEIKPDII